MPEEVRIGIIGTGGIAGVHAENYKKTPGARVVAACDVVPGKAEAFLARFGFDDARAFTDHRQMLEEPIDAVSVCTPNAFHAQTAIDALAAGKHVLVEKPMSVTLAEGVEMVRAARAAGRILSVGFQSRYSRTVTAAREIVQSGGLGRVYYVETGGGRRKGIPGGSFVSKATAGGGAVLDIGCYSLDTAMFVLGHPRPLTVSAYLSAHFGTSPVYSRTASWGGVDPDRFDVEDFGAAMVRLEGDICLMFKISWAMHLDTLGPSLWLGTEGGLKLSDGLEIFHDRFGRDGRTELPINRRGGR
ncbi:MAG TPA: Gfo/Idh/MocA family oxidoreductase, partial [Limnochordia bacterium]